MAANSRQSNLFAGEVWSTLYRAFSSINFNASDPPTIAAALRTYIQTYFPENYNDWIENSEFVAIIELLSWLAGNLAFKTDLSVRENFLDTAESRESILRLARFLSYNPSRNQAATGLVKLVQVSTDDTVYDSFGTDLANLPIIWNNPNDTNWLERFTAVLNNAFVPTNPFGVPLKDGMLSAIPTQLYRINNTFAEQSVTFSSSVSGVPMAFELCNGDFTDGATMFERTPAPGNAAHVFYMNDSNGYDSAFTGFFLLFKQGNTMTQTFSITTPVENQLLDIVSQGVNNNDVWVQTIDDTGNVLTRWTPVPSVLSSNITYNSLPIGQRDIYQVITRDNDAVSIRFSDGRFGNAPTGLIQVTYRVSNGFTYQIKPNEIDRISLPFSFTNADGIKRTLTMTFSLFAAVDNAAAAETIEQIRSRATQVYATQNRMVSGEDLNTFPLTLNVAAKVKAVNRVYSGQSRYTRLEDPTGTYSDLNIVGDDGILFKEVANAYAETPLTLNRTPSEITAFGIQPALQVDTVANAYRDTIMQGIQAGNALTGLSLHWNQATGTAYTSSGYFTNVPGNALSIGGIKLIDLLRPGALIRYSQNSVVMWTAIVELDGVATLAPVANTPGPVTLSTPLANNTIITAIIPRFDPNLDTAAVSAINDRINNKLSFSLWYDLVNGWLVQSPAVSLGTPALVGSAMLMMTVDYLPGFWRMSTQGLRYVFESVAEVEWYDDGRRAFDADTGEKGNDLVRVLPVNIDRNDFTGRSLGQAIDFGVAEIYLYPDGSPEPRRTVVNLADANNDGYPDTPDAFYRVVSNLTSGHYLFWKQNSDISVSPYTGMKVYATETLRSNATGTVGVPAFQISSSTSVRQNTFWTWTGTAWQQDVSGTYSYAIGRGPNVATSWVDTSTSTPTGDQMFFQWKHYAVSDHRIDPAQTNIHDVFVLTSGYDTTVRQWVVAGADPAKLPTPPTELDLRLAFTSLEANKVFSDTLIWRPVRYKFLFGPSAAPELQAQFKVVTLPNSSVSDGEVKTRVITAVNEYFAVSNWDFGETFYFTELVSYVHLRLAGLIASCVLVPLGADGVFGDGFEVTCRPDEIFISTAQVSNVTIIGSNTPGQLRIGS